MSSQPVACISTRAPCLPIRFGVQQNVAAEHRGRAIAWIVVGQAPDEGQIFPSVSTPRLAWKQVIGAAHGERKAIALWQDYGGAKLLNDVEFNLRNSPSNNP